MATVSQCKSKFTLTANFKTSVPFLPNLQLLTGFCRDLTSATGSQLQSPATGEVIRKSCNGFVHCIAYKPITSKMSGTAKRLHKQFSVLVNQEQQSNGETASFSRL